MRNVLPSYSREVLSAGPSVGGLRASAAVLRRTIRLALE
jgi:hypothetical protein